MKKLLIIFTAIVTGVALTLSLSQGSKLITAEEIKSKCGSSEDCYEKIFTNMAEKESSDVVLRLLEESANKNGINLNCHNLSHKIGSILYKKEGERSLEIKTHICSDGLLHGIAEAASKDISISEYGKFYTDYCKKVYDIKSGCIHGIGHVMRIKKVSKINTEKVCTEISNNLEASEPISKDVVFASNMDYLGNCIDGFVMEEANNNIRSVLPEGVGEYCKDFSGKSWYYCSFEYLRTAVNNNTGRFKDSKGIELTVEKKFGDYVTFCIGIKDDYYRSGCGFYIGELLEEIYLQKPLDFLEEEFVKNCVTGKDQLFAKSCILGFTTKIVNYNIYTTEETEKFCSKLDQELKDFCIFSLPKKFQQEQ